MAAAAAAEVDDSICPVCRGTTYVGETISCETCLYWFHFECVGVKHTDEFVQNEDVPYYCPGCSGGGTAGLPAAVVEVHQPVVKGADGAAGLLFRDSDIFDDLDDEDVGVDDGPPSTTTKKRKRGTSGWKVRFTPPSKKRTAAKQSGGSFEKHERSSRKRKAPPVPAAAAAVVAPSPAEAPLDAEESKWLDAVESGDLGAAENLDHELKKIKDPKLMTARQRALTLRSSGGGVKGQASGDQADQGCPDEHQDPRVVHRQQSPSDGDCKRSRKMSGLAPEDEEELKLKAAAKTALRKQMELEKREESKQRTLEKLLRKKRARNVRQKQRGSSSMSSLSGDAKRRVMAGPEDDRDDLGRGDDDDSDPGARASAGNQPEQHSDVPMISYRANASGIWLHLPAGVEYPLGSCPKVGPKVIKTLCQVCMENPRKYSCSATKVSLCSFECYQRNKETTRPQMLVWN